MKFDYTTNCNYLSYTFLFKRLGKCTFLSLVVKGLTFHLTVWNFITSLKNAETIFCISRGNAVHSQLEFNDCHEVCKMFRWTVIFLYYSYTELQSPELIIFKEMLWRQPTSLQFREFFRIISRPAVLLHFFEHAFPWCHSGARWKAVLHKDLPSRWSCILCKFPLYAPDLPVRLSFGTASPVQRKASRSWWAVQTGRYSGGVFLPACCLSPLVGAVCDHRLGWGAPQMEKWSRPAAVPKFLLLLPLSSPAVWHQLRNVWKSKLETAYGES